MPDRNVTQLGEAPRPLLMPTVSRLDLGLQSCPYTVMVSAGSSGCCRKKGVSCVPLFLYGREKANQTCVIDTLAPLYLRMGTRLSEKNDFFCLDLRLWLLRSVGKQASSLSLHIPGIEANAWILQVPDSPCFSLMLTGWEICCIGSGLKIFQSRYPNSTYKHIYGRYTYSNPS